VTLLPKQKSKLPLAVTVRSGSAYREVVYVAVVSLQPLLVVTTA
jgi:hypothetical protein